MVGSIADPWSAGPVTLMGQAGRSSTEGRCLSGLGRKLQSRALMGEERPFAPDCRQRLRLLFFLLVPLNLISEIADANVCESCSSDTPANLKATACDTANLNLDPQAFFNAQRRLLSRERQDLFFGEGACFEPTREAT